MRTREEAEEAERSACASGDPRKGHQLGMTSTGLPKSLLHDKGSWWGSQEAKRIALDFQVFLLLSGP